MRPGDPNYGRQEEPRAARIPTGGGMTAQDERTWSMLSHLSVLLWFITGLLAFLFFITILLIPVGLVLLVPWAPLVVWFVYKDRSRRVRFHAAQAFWYQVAWLVVLNIGWFITVFLSFFIIGLLLVPLMIIVNLAPFVHAIYAGVKVNQGVDYRYPIIADMVDGGQRVI